MAWFKSEDDTDFYSETVAANLSRPSRITLGIMLFIIGFIIFMFVLSIVKTRETSVIAMGNVTPSTSLRQLESLEQGIVAQIHKRESQHVLAGEPILTLVFSEKHEQLASARSRYYSLLAKKARIEALINEVEPFFPQNLLDASPESVVNERSVYEETIKQLDSLQEIYSSRVVQKLSEHESALAEQTKIENNLDLINKNIEIIAPLVEKNAQPEIRLIQSNREKIEEEGRLKNNEADLFVTKESAELAKLELQGKRWEIYQEKASELTETIAEINELEILIAGYEADIKRETIRAPANGIIQKMHVNSVGNIALSGNPLVDFVPDDETTLVSVKVNPKDRGNVVECLYTDIEITAFNADKYGLIEGWVERISPDSIEDEKGRTYFLADVRSPVQQVKEPGKEEYYDITIGMEAKVFIQTGRKKLFQYVFKPIAKNLNSWETNPDQFNEQCIQKVREENVKVF